jgi:hypothetical protein
VEVKLRRRTARSEQRKEEEVSGEKVRSKKSAVRSKE